MVFSSTVFLFIFLPIVLGLYFACPARFRNVLLLAASLIFYAYGEPKYVLIMIASIMFNYICGAAIEKINSRRGPKGFVLAFCVAGNLAVLGYFKYTDFLLENINRLAGTTIGLMEIALPIGISFYTFQAMSYVIDVYRGKVKAADSLINFATYVTMFPQLIAGPIVRYITVEEQLKVRTCSIDKASVGVRRFIIGLGKKVLLANQIGIIWDEISRMDTGTLPAATAWLGAIAFTFQIYFDFSGYSDMAIGLGKILGFDFDENFNYPYTAKSVTDFWRRWHISLSTWFKEYVYIPLGGNRKGLARQLLNISIVWMLTGLWHGASWNFVLWGMYFGVLLIVEKLFLLKALDKAPAAVEHLYALFIIVFGWVIFSLTDADALGAYIRALFGAAGFADATTAYYIRTAGLLFAVCAIGSTKLPASLCGKIFGCLSAGIKTAAAGSKTSAAVGTIASAETAEGGNMSAAERKSEAAALIVIENAFFLVTLLLCAAFLVSDTYNPFLYFRF